MASAFLAAANVQRGHNAGLPDSRGGKWRKNLPWLILLPLSSAPDKPDISDQIVNPLPWKFRFPLLVPRNELILVL